MLEQYRFTVDLLPEEDGAFTLWVPELGVGESSATVKDARQALVDVVCVYVYVQQYWQRYDAWQYVPAKNAQWPYVLRLSLAHDDREILAMLLESAPRRDATRRRGKRAREPAALGPSATPFLLHVGEYFERGTGSLLWRRALSHPGTPARLPAQVAQQFIKCAAVEVLRIDDYMIAPPLQAMAVCR